MTTPLPSRAVIQLQRSGPDLTVTGVGRSLVSLLQVGQQVIELDPQPIADETDPAWLAFVGEFNLAATAALAATQQQLASAIEARNEAEAQLGSALRERDAALAEVGRLREQLNPPAESTLMYPADFADLFTAAEQDAIDEATDPVIRRARRRVYLVRWVDRANEETTAYLAYLRYLGILATDDRVTRIRAGLPPE